MSQLQHLPNDPDRGGLSNTNIQQRRNLGETLPPFLMAALYWVLANENSDCGVSFRRGAVCIKHISRAFVGSVIAAAVATAHGFEIAAPKVAFLPLCFIGFRDRSHWAAIRLCNIGLDPNVAAKRAAKLFTCLRAHARQRWTILEQCPNGDSQLWVVTMGFSSHATWRKLLIRTLTDAGLEPEPDKCEIFPAVDNSLMGPPAPGSWDPHYDATSQIIAANIDGLVRAKEVQK